MNNICAFYQTYRNRKSTEFVLKNFRKHHPSSPITLISDAGCNFSDLAKKYNCSYDHRFLNLGRQGHQNIKLDSEYPVNPGLAFNKEEALVWIQRFYDACLYGVGNECDYILMLEDDVYVKNKITFLPECDGFCCGPENRENLINPNLINYLSNKYQVKCNVDYYACCGGAIFNASMFVKNYYSIVKFINDDFYTILSLDDKMGWIDFFMHIIYFYLGCTYTPNPQFAETWMKQKWNIDWESPQYSIIHQYKDLY